VWEDLYQEPEPAGKDYSVPAFRLRKRNVVSDIGIPIEFTVCRRFLYQEPEPAGQDYSVPAFRSRKRKCGKLYNSPKNLQCVEGFCIKNL
jgi:hypothetical protein